MNTLTKTTAEKQKLNEKEIEQFIVNSPSTLCLGEIEIIKSQYNQISGGIIDILALDSINNIYYEIELMLGEVDSIHVGHILDYWVREKSEKMYSNHIAVIISESIRGRFQKLLSVLPDYIPIICSEFTILKNDKGDVFFNCEPIYFPNTIKYKNFKIKNKSINMISKQSLVFMNKILETPSILKENRRKMSELTGVSLGSTCKFIKNLQDLKFLDEDLNVINKNKLEEYTKYVSYIY